MRAASRPSLAGPGVRNQSWLPAIAPPPPPSTYPRHLWLPDFISGASCPATEQWIRARRGSSNRCVAHGLAVAVSDSILSCGAASHFHSTTRLATPYDAMARMATTRPPRITAAASWH